MKTLGHQISNQEKLAIYNSIKREKVDINWTWISSSMTPSSLLNFTNASSFTFNCRGKKSVQDVSSRNFAIHTHEFNNKSTHCPFYPLVLPATKQKHYPALMTSYIRRCNIQIELTKSIPWAYYDISASSSQWIVYRLAQIRFPHFL